MPEGDTVFRTARTLDRALTGHVVTAFETALAALAAVDRQAPVSGRTVLAVTALGKHLLLHLSGGLVLRSHLRMHGSWHIYRPGERWRAPRRDARIVVATAAWVGVAFNVVDAELMTTAGLDRHDRLSSLGPDLLAGAPDLAAARQRMDAAADRQIAEVLLDQRVVAGLGNVFKSELLFLERVHPSTRVADLPGEVLDALLSRGRALLQLNVSERAGLVAGPGRVTTGRLNPRERLWVYGRTGRPCFRCRSPIVSAVTEGRRTYWCPTCQPVPGRP